jgi:hypothetical protein
MIDLKKLSNREIEILFVELNEEFQNRFGICIHKEKPKFVDKIEPLPPNFDLIKKLQELKIKIFLGNSIIE